VKKDREKVAGVHGRCDDKEKRQGERDRRENGGRRLKRIITKLFIVKCLQANAP
jgi:hypothetical protein